MSTSTAVERQVVAWIADRTAISDEFFTLPEAVQQALEVLGHRVGVDGRRRAAEFPGEANRFRLARLEAAGLPSRAHKQLRQLLRSDARTFRTQPL